MSEVSVGRMRQMQLEKMKAARRRAAQDVGGPGGEGGPYTGRPGGDLRNQRPKDAPTVRKPLSAVERMTMLRMGRQPQDAGGGPQTGRPGGNLRDQRPTTSPKVTPTTGGPGGEAALTPQEKLRLQQEAFRNQLLQQKEERRRAQQPTQRSGAPPTLPNEQLPGAGGGLPGGDLPNPGGGGGLSGVGDLPQGGGPTLTGDPRYTNPYAELAGRREGGNQVQLRNPVAPWQNPLAGLLGRVEGQNQLPLATPTEPWRNPQAGLMGRIEGGNQIQLGAPTRPWENPYAGLLGRMEGQNQVPNIAPGSDIPGSGNMFDSAPWNFQAGAGANPLFTDFGLPRPDYNNPYEELAGRREADPRDWILGPGGGQRIGGPPGGGPPTQEGGGNVGGDENDPYVNPYGALAFRNEGFQLPLDLPGPGGGSHVPQPYHVGGNPWDHLPGANTQIVGGDQSTRPDQDPVVTGDQSTRPDQDPTGSNPFWPPGWDPGDHPDRSGDVPWDWTPPTGGDGDTVPPTGPTEVNDGCPYGYVRGPGGCVPDPTIIKPGDDGGSGGDGGDTGGGDGDTGITGSDEWPWDWTPPGPGSGGGSYFDPSQPYNPQQFSFGPNPMNAQLMHMLSDVMRARGLDAVGESQLADFRAASDDARNQLAEDLSGLGLLRTSGMTANQLGRFEADRLRGEAGIRAGVQQRRDALIPHAQQLASDAFGRQFAEAQFGEGQRQFAEGARQFGESLGFARDTEQGRVQLAYDQIASGEKLAADDREELKRQFNQSLGIQSRYTDALLDEMRGDQTLTSAAQLLATYSDDTSLPTHTKNALAELILSRVEDPALRDELRRAFGLLGPAPGGGGPPRGGGGER